MLVPLALERVLTGREDCFYHPFAFLQLRLNLAPELNGRYSREVNAKPDPVVNGSKSASRQQGIR